MIVLKERKKKKRYESKDHGRAAACACEIIDSNGGPSLVPKGRIAYRFGRAIQTRRATPASAWRTRCVIRRQLRALRIARPATRVPQPWVQSRRCLVAVLLLSRSTSSSSICFILFTPYTFTLCMILVRRISLSLSLSPFFSLYIYSLFVFFYLLSHLRNAITFVSLSLLGSPFAWCPKKKKRERKNACNKRWSLWLPACERSRTLCSSSPPTFVLSINRREALTLAFFSFFFFFFFFFFFWRFDRLTFDRRWLINACYCKFCRLLTNFDS